MRSNCDRIAIFFIVQCCAALGQWGENNLKAKHVYIASYLAEERTLFCL